MSEGTKVIVGTQGDSAADVARKQGFEGDDAAWLAFLEQGAKDQATLAEASAVLAGSSANEATLRAAEAESARARAEAAVSDVQAPTDGMNESLIKSSTSKTNSALVTLIDDRAPALNVRLFGAVGDGVHDDTSSVSDAVAEAVSKNLALEWPGGRYLTTGSIPNLHKVRHLGGGRIQRGLSAFTPSPSSRTANKLFVAANGSPANDGISVDHPLDKLSTAFAALPNYGPVTPGIWTIQLAAGTYNDQAITGQRSENRIWIEGASVDPGTVPTTIFEPGALGYAKAIGGNNGLLIGLRNLKAQGYLAAESPAFDFSTHCDLWFDNVHGTGNDIGYRIMNGSKYRMDGCIWDGNTQYGGQELFSVVRDFKSAGPSRPSYFRGNGKTGIKAKELCTGHLDFAHVYNNKHGVHLTRSCTANASDAKIYGNQYGVTLQNQSSFVPLRIDWKFGTPDANSITPWDVDASSSFVTNENEAISPTVFSGRGELILGSFAPDTPTIHTGTSTATTMCTLGNLRRGSLARPGGYVRAVIVGSKGGSSGAVTIDFRFANSTAGTIVVPAVAHNFKIEVLVFSRGQGKQTVLATESLTGAAPQRVDRAYDVNDADKQLSVRATLAATTDTVTIHGAWCYTTEALASDG